MQNTTLFPEIEMKGSVESLTFYKEETGYSVAHFYEKSTGSSITIVGNMPGIKKGENLVLYGSWTNHPTYGRQFEVKRFQFLPPETAEAMVKYLASGLIKGVGPVTAEKIVRHFGDRTLEILDQEPCRLVEVPTIGKKRADTILAGWEEQKKLKHIMLLLQSYGVNPALALKIHRQYGDDAAQIIHRDPYQLARDIFGVGFLTADKIALQIGLAKDSVQRVQAGVVYTLENMSMEGHCYAIRDQLADECVKLLGNSSASCLSVIDDLVKDARLVQVEDAVYLPYFYQAEIIVAEQIRQLSTSPRDRLSIFQDADWDAAFSWLDKAFPVALTDEQRKAVRMVLSKRISILTGGPGTGKSTIAGSIITLVQSYGHSVLLAAPTGRAAKRLSAATGLDAQTIHRLLEYSPVGNQFQRNQRHPLDADLIIIDETSMIDILLMQHFLSAVTSGTHVVFIGDQDQLPSVGAGNVLKDLISSGVLPMVRLTNIFRQSEGSHIIENAHRINHGEMLIFKNEFDDFFLFQIEQPEKAEDWVVDISTERMLAHFSIPFKDIQVLSPMHRGPAGVTALNQRLQQAVNPPNRLKNEFHSGNRIFRVGDRVMQLRNNYEKMVFNGDIGVIASINLEDQQAVIDYEGLSILYGFGQFDEVQHAYAISIHKSQGSEFPVVVLPLLTQHYMLLQRNVLYTAITRAKKKVVLVGTKKAIGMSIKNNRATLRNTRLARLLREHPADEIPS